MTRPPKIHIGLLGLVDNPYLAELQRAARAHFPHVATTILRSLDLRVGLGSDSANRLSLSADQSGPLQAILVRSMPVGSLEQVIFRMDCLQAWMHRGVEVINTPRCLEIAIDKWLCLERLAVEGIPVPPTICCQTRSAAMQAFELLGGDVLIKPLFGGEGRGILRATDPDMAWRMFGTLQQLGQVLYVQQFVEHFGYDIRVLYVGERCYAIRRRAVAATWRTNVSQGAIAEPHQMTDEQADVAQRSRAVVDGKLLGVDLLPARDGRLFVLEVNAVPGWRGLAGALKIDIAKEVMQLAVSRVERSL